MVDFPDKAETILSPMGHRLGMKTSLSCGRSRIAARSFSLIVCPETRMRITSPPMLRSAAAMRSTRSMALGSRISTAPRFAPGWVEGEASPAG